MPKRTSMTWFAALALVNVLCVDAKLSPSRRHICIEWDSAAAQGVKDAKMGAPMAARALAIVHTCMYDAWAAYDEHSVGTQLRGALRRPANERTEANKRRAISYAAYRALVDVLPGDTESVYKPLMRELGYDPNDHSTDIETPAGIGNVACAAVLEYRHRDGANQLGDHEPGIGEGSATTNEERSLPSLGMTKVRVGTPEDLSIKANTTKRTPEALGPYGDWSGYEAVNGPSTVSARGAPIDPDRWQPLVYTDATGNLVLQRFAGAQWCFVKSFAMSKGDEFRSMVEPGPAKYGSPEYQQQADELIALSANLTDRQKMIAEYWSDGPNTEQPPGHWMRFAQFISQRDHHTLDDDVKMFFALTNAMLDAGIAAWDAKRTYDSVRPVTAIAVLYRGKKISAWGGPGKGTVEMEGTEWRPYQLATSPTPPFPEYVSGHSTYSAAAARILQDWTGSEHFGYSVTLPAGSSQIEPGITPKQAVMLSWETFADAANEAGMSRRYGGIHFARADVEGRKLGNLVAEKAWAKAQAYFDGTIPVGVQEVTAANNP